MAVAGQPKQFRLLPSPTVSVLELSYSCSLLLRLKNILHFLKEMNVQKQRKHTLNWSLLVAKGELSPFRIPVIENLFPLSPYRLKANLKVFKYLLFL